MIERCLGAYRCRRIQRALRHLKVTVLCLVLTVVVLRGTIGAGKFGTPEQDLDEIRQHFQTSRKRAEPHRVLEEIQTGGGGGGGGDSIFVDEGEEEKPDPNKPDAMFTDMAFELPWERYKDYNLVMHGWNEMVYDDKNWIGLNTGSFLLRNNQWALDLLDTWAPMGPKGKIREEAGKVLTRELKGRPVFEADDQSAMVYLLATQRDTWGNKVYLENGYYLHGYWGILVDRYEEMIENYHPGLGDHRWPLVTHFVGCKPCGKFGDYPVERCLKQMDRAFNFGDNQILQIYGFTHKSLASRKVKRVRNETSNPLEMKDELGLLHPAFKAVKVQQTNQV
ncbi:BnaC03g30890D [Brassica napus]|uniref:BnaC03g30890D protein n=1 Tax=Brassica napus TaxID=3708 RepID=A0A078FZ16_BRANA|nr:BnaC03g30890D [Brassica napus]